MPTHSGTCLHLCELGSLAAGPWVCFALRHSWRQTSVIIRPPVSGGGASSSWDEGALRREEGEALWNRVESMGALFNHVQPCSTRLNSGHWPLKAEWAPVDVTGQLGTEQGHFAPSCSSCKARWGMLLGSYGPASCSSTNEQIRIQNATSSCEIIFELLDSLDSPRCSLPWMIRADQAICFALRQASPSSEGRKMCS